MSKNVMAIHLYQPVAKIISKDDLCVDADWFVTLERHLALKNKWPIFTGTWLNLCQSKNPKSQLVLNCRIPIVQQTTPVKNYGILYLKFRLSAQCFGFYAGLFGYLGPWDYH